MPPLQTDHSAHSHSRNIAVLPFRTSSSRPPPHLTGHYAHFSGQSQSPTPTSTGPSMQSQVTDEL
ncbi:hypothetical protein E2C01_015294 [Portunus trituberculatus]|uniref:Uncharacterized protein n=1 Tax=Portunus trituberculatus TaxID=210409 RepID=A0A5B7DMK4_PORTR|nr:hypothetical protein [Portunus trituberculatus]